MRDTKVVTADAGVALHRQLFLVLHDEIARGALAPGDPLPSEQSLGEQFGVSRITVRRALADLADHGLIERRHGVGSFVRQSGSTRPPELQSYTDELRQTQFETDVDVVEFDTRTAPAAVAEALGADGEMLHILRVRRERRTGEPLMITEAWLPADLAEPVSPVSLTERALYDLLADAGVKIGRMVHEMTAEIATPVTAKLLEVAIGSALIRVNRVAYASKGAAGRPHHYLSITMSPSRSRVLISQSMVDDDSGLAIAHDVRR
ncbi:GntR family transcriptional regulator [Mycobacterium sp. OTB74]|uniref:GntR family transcriptional regulator n=1 Tax=Mycobacterium sp. OTB74 TaxID=1853452 RepID=UPI0024772B17|nr:GntR family transcriptional regulator [Mycobacterium sp. OTB74]MDH6245905.1 GntR family transcriptional regulator [Mycobacterium sp. OTB74]